MATATLIFDTLVSLSLQPTSLNGSAVAGSSGGSGISFDLDLVHFTITTVDPSMSVSVVGAPEFAINAYYPTHIDAGMRNTFAKEKRRVSDNHDHELNNYRYTSGCNIIIGSVQLAEYHWSMVHRTYKRNYSCS
jgi:hypothetical protein